MMRFWGRNFLAACKARPKRIALIVLIAVLFFARVWRLKQDVPQAAPRPLPVQTAPVSLQDVPVFLHTIGSITAENSVLVKSRVDGELLKIHFTEGQLVEKGELLAEIDPQPYAVRLAQAEGIYARDLAMLQGAQQDLARYQKLVKEGSVSLQQLQAQEALTGQYQGALLSDKANIDDARLQLSYCRIVAPISGRAGLRLVDQGNMIRANESAGIVTLAQTEPTLANFSIVERDLPDVLQGFQKGPLKVEAWSAGDKQKLATGELAFLDNQIDPATGSLRAKAIFQNPDQPLLPNQFVNIRLFTRVQKNALVAPSAAVQRGPNGFFVFIVTPDEAAQNTPDEPAQSTPQKSALSGLNGSSRHVAGDMVSRPLPKRSGTVLLQPIQAGYSAGGQSILESGVHPGDLLVTDGVDQLRPGSRVIF